MGQHLAIRTGDWGEEVAVGFDKRKNAFAAGQGRELWTEGAPKADGMAVPTINRWGHDEGAGPQLIGYGLRGRGLDIGPIGESYEPTGRAAGNTHPKGKTRSFASLRVRATEHLKSLLPQ